MKETYVKYVGDFFGGGGGQRGGEKRPVNDAQIYGKIK